MGIPKGVAYSLCNDVMLSQEANKILLVSIILIFALFNSGENTVDVFA